MKDLLQKFSDVNPMKPFTINEVKKEVAEEIENDKKKYIKTEYGNVINRIKDAMKRNKVCLSYLVDKPEFVHDIIDMLKSGGFICEITSIDGDGYSLRILWKEN